jgi:hypothetical protein
MREAFRTINLRPDSLALVARCNTILDDYQAQGLRLTLRQLYYQLVTKNVIPNTEKSYKRLSSIVSDARLGGLMDWAAIEDRVRVPRSPSEWDNLADLVEGALYSYRLPRWAGQNYYVELWVEKDALAGVLAPLASKYHVTMMVNRGYSSQSAMYEAAQRFNRCATGDGEAKAPVLLYLGDHDPSGEDMVRDVRERLEMFGVDGIEVRKIALTTAQVQQYQPPPNPAKVTDPRAAAYIAQHGPVSWEVDALPPPVLTQVISDAIEEFVDLAMMDEVKVRECADKVRLREAAKQISREE